MIMTNTKQCQSCVYGEFWARVGWVCKRAFDAQKDIVYQDRISNRTESKCFDYEKRGKRKMNAIIVDKDKKEEVKTVENTVEKPVESVEKSDDKPKKRKWTDEDIQTLIHFYNKGTKPAVLADMFGVTKSNISNKIYELKQSEKWSGYFTDSTTISKTETLPEPEKPVSKKRKVYKAGGIGFIEAGGGMMALDGKPLIMDISDFLEKSGMTNFYGKVEIKITPIQPTGIQISVEAE